MIEKYILNLQGVKELLEILNINPNKIDKVKISVISKFKKITERYFYKSSMVNLNVSRLLFVVFNNNMIEGCPIEYYFEEFGNENNLKNKKIDKGITKKFLEKNFSDARYFVFVEEVKADYLTNEPTGIFLTIVFTSKEKGRMFLKRIKKEINQEIEEINKKIN